MIVLLIVVVWFAIGAGAFIKEWTLRYDFTLDLLPVAFVPGLGGPVVFLLYVLERYKPKRKVVLFKKVKR